jgi:hypothetical protein
MNREREFQVSKHIRVQPNKSNNENKKIKLEIHEKDKLVISMLQKEFKLQKELDKYENNYAKRDEELLRHIKSEEYSFDSLNNIKTAKVKYSDSTPDSITTYNYNKTDIL